jgi:hypothetical protein
MAFMYGLYPPSTNPRLMQENQTSYALPQIKISEDILIEVQSNLQRAALPGNTQLYTIGSVEKDYDTFLPVSTCQYIRGYQPDKN